MKEDRVTPAGSLFALRWEPGPYHVRSRFFRLVVARACLTVQWDLMSRREWEIGASISWGTVDPSYRKDYARIWLGPGVIPF